MARRQTPYYHKLAAMGAQFGELLDFAVALRISGTESEHLATRSSVGVFDVMYQGVIEVVGRDAMSLLQGLVVNDVERLGDGSGMYTSMLNEDGGMVDDLTLFRLDDERYWVCPTPRRTDAVVAWIRGHVHARCAHVTNLTSGTAYLSVQGPLSRSTLEKLTDTDISSTALPYFHNSQAEVAAVPTRISRTGYSGELGFELFYPRDYAEYMWDSVMTAGSDFGIQPCGLGCLSSLGLEKKFLLWGRELDETTTPWEADLGWTVHLDKGDFIGRQALVDAKARPLTRLIVGLAFENTSFVPAPGARVSAGGQEVGRVTTGGIGYSLGQSLALAWLDPGYATHGARVDVEEEGRFPAHPATVSRRAFYDPDRTRQRS